MHVTKPRFCVLEKSSAFSSTLGFYSRKNSAAPTAYRGQPNLFLHSDHAQNQMLLMGSVQKKKK